MRLQVLGCFGGDLNGRFPAFLVNSSALLDAGAIGVALSLEQQLKIDSVFLTHQHIDHLIGLPFFIESIFAKRSQPVVIYGLKDVILQVKTHLLNDILWPDFTRLPTQQTPTMRFQDVELDHEITLSQDLAITPIPTFHTRGSCGFIIRSGRESMVYSGDTGPCDSFWRSIRRFRELNPQARVAAIVIECSFPNRLSFFAEETRHLTPDSLKSELCKLEMDDAKILVFHMKPQYISEIGDEIRSIKEFYIEMLTPGQELNF
jgi:cAMP phosphodiesterase